MCTNKEFWYGDFGAHHEFKIETSKFLMTTCFEHILDIVGKIKVK
jgi:hypothetical protein